MTKAEFTPGKQYGTSLLTINGFQFYRAKKVADKKGTIKHTCKITGCKTIVRTKIINGEEEVMGVPDPPHDHTLVPKK